MQQVPRIVGTVTLLAAALAISSCKFILPFDPCMEKDGIEDVGQMDKTWSLQTVNGVSLPYPTLNILENEKITKLELDFESDYRAPLPRGCDEVYETEGNALGQITLNTNGRISIKQGTARFRRNHSKNTGIIVAPNGGVAFRRESLKGTRMTISSTDLFYLTGAKQYLGPNLTLVFVRTRGPNE